MFATIIIKRKMWVIVGIVLVLSVACSSGSKGSEQLAGTNSDRACEIIRGLHTEARQAQADVASGELTEPADMFQRAMALNARVQVLAQSLEPSELQVVVKQWVAAGDAMLANKGTDQAESLRTVALDARDRVDDLCGLPHGPR